MTMNDHRFLSKYLTSLLKDNDTKNGLESFSFEIVNHHITDGFNYNCSMILNPYLTELVYKIFTEVKKIDTKLYLKQFGNNCRVTVNKNYCKKESLQN